MPYKGIQFLLEALRHFRHEDAFTCVGVFPRDFKGAITVIAQLYFGFAAAAVVGRSQCC